MDVALLTALNSGYRLIDTANAYKNEKVIGNTLQKWIVNGGKRKELFITTKVYLHNFFFYLLKIFNGGLIILLNL